MGKKRGSFNDVLFVGYLLFAVGMAVVISSIIVNAFQVRFNDMAAADPKFNASYDPTTLVQTQSALHQFDNLFIVLMVGLQLAVIAAALQVRSHPYFYWLTFIFNVIAILFMAVLSNIWFAFVDEASASIAAGFPLIQWTIHYLPMITLVGSAILALTVYNRKEGNWW